MWPIVVLELALEAFSFASLQALPLGLFKGMVFAGLTFGDHLFHSPLPESRVKKRAVVALYRSYVPVKEPADGNCVWERRLKWRPRSYSTAGGAKRVEWGRRLSAGETLIDLNGIDGFSFATIGKSQASTL